MTLSTRMMMTMTMMVDGVCTVWSTISGKDSMSSQIDISTVAILRSGVFLGRDIFEIWYLHLNPLKETLFPL